MNDLEEYENLIKLEKEYRLKHAGIEDTNAKDRYYIDKEIFPNWWFPLLDNSLKIELITNALENKITLFDLEEVKIIERTEINSKLNDNIFTE